MNKKFIIRYFDINSNEWATREVQNHQHVLTEIESIGMISWDQLFVYEVRNDVIKRKWGVGLIEDENIDEQI